MEGGILVHRELRDPHRERMETGAESCVCGEGSAMVALQTDHELSFQEQPRQSGSDFPWARQEN